MGQSKLKLEIKTFEDYIYYLCASNNRENKVFRVIDDEGNDILQMFVTIEGQSILFEIDELLENEFILKILRGYGKELSDKVTNHLK